MEKHYPILILAILSAALVCDYDPEPYIDREFSLKIPFINWQVFDVSDITWICESNTTDYKCNSYVIDNGDTIQVNPRIEDVDETGRVSQFESLGNLIQVQYRAEMNVLRPEKDYTFKVICDNSEQFNASVRPQYRELDRPTEGIFWGINSAGLIVGLFIVLLFLIIFYSIWRGIIFGR